MNNYKEFLFDDKKITDSVNEIFVDGEEVTSILPLICMSLIIGLIRNIINFYVETSKKIDDFKL